MSSPVRYNYERALIKKENYIKDPKMHCFSGYYDINVFSNDSKNLIFYKKNKMSLDVFTYDILNRYESKVCSTKSWSTQQGAMAQFLNGSNNEIVLNVSDHQKHHCIIKNLKNGKIKEFDYPYYDIDSKNEVFLSLNFDSLDFYAKGYGYRTISKQKAPFIAQIDFRNKKTQLLYSIEEILLCCGIDNDASADYYVNHLKFRPQSKDFIFLLRKRVSSKSFLTSLVFFSNSEKKFTRCTNFSHFSHFCWVNKDELLFFGTHQNKTSYFIYDFKSFSIKDINLEGSFNDGHPSYNRLNNYVVSDTYPEHNRHQKLFLWSLNSKSRRDIKSFYSPIKFYDHNRCDLHPRWSKDGKIIAVDTSESGKREIRLIFLK